MVGPPSSDILEKLKDDSTNPTGVVPSLDEEGAERARTEVLPVESLPHRSPSLREGHTSYDRAETAILTVSSGDVPALAPPPSFTEDGPKSSVSGTALAAQPASPLLGEESALPDGDAGSARTNRVLMAIAGLLFVLAAGIVILALARG